jgi:tetratricopeptide (TPR) repeat protein
LFLLAAVEIAEAGPDEKKAKAELVAAQALVAYDASDRETALKMARKALKKDPENLVARYVRASAMLDVLESGAIGGGPDVEALQQALRDELDGIAEAGGAASFVAIRALVRLSASRGPLIPEPTYACPPEAEAAIAQAESLFMQRDYAGATPYYEAALQQCPQNATWWIYYGDVFFQQEQWPGAIEKYRAALALDPCFAPAHRFLSDAFVRTGEAIPALGEAVLAVACNPDYEVGWTWLGGFAEASGGRLRYADVAKPMRVPQGASVGDVTSSDPADVEYSLWFVYAVSRHGPHAADATAMDHEQAAVRAALARFGERLPAEDSARPGLRAWQLLAEADREGNLDLAVYALLLDEALVGDYLVWRTQPDNLTRMSMWITREMVLFTPG